MKKSFYIANILYFLSIIYGLAFAYIWGISKDYSMSMREIWLVLLPFVVTLIISAIINLLNLKNKDISKKLLYIFLSANLIGVAFLIKTLFFY